MRRLRGTLWRLLVQVGLHGCEVLLTGHRLRGGRLGSRKCDGTGRFAQTVEGAVEVDGGIASYNTFMVVIRDQGKLVPVVFVGRNLGLEWLDASSVIDGVTKASSSKT